MIERTQTGIRIATPLLKVLKALAEHKDMTLGDLIEGIVLHALEAKQPFCGDTIKVIGKLKVVALLESLPGVGKVKARAIMSEVGISETRRVRGLGPHQIKALVERFG